MYNVQTMVLVYRVLIEGGGREGHLDWQVLRAPQYVNPALRGLGGAAARPGPSSLYQM